MSIISRLFLPDYLRQDPAWMYPRILVGAGGTLTHSFQAKYNITHVINCADDDMSPPWFRARYPDNYTSLNAIDSVRVNILSWYPKFEETLRRYLREGTGTVYVHCHAGMNRSGFLAMAYVCSNMGLDADSLVRAARRQRPCILQNPVFMDQVKEFINGRVQSEKAERVHNDTDSNRNIGLTTSGDGPDPTRV